MKRSREEAHAAAASPVRRPQAPRADLAGAPTMAAAPPAGGMNQRLSTEDALTYLKDVKKIFENNKEKYDEFLEVMRDFKSQRINTCGVIDRVKELFKGHRHLILGFNAFLPKGYEITLPPEEKKPVEFEQAINYVNRIKTRFRGADHVYKSFLDILNMYRNQSKSIQEVYNEVSLLFQSHKDLLDEFTHFLPEASGASHHHAQLGKPYLPRDDKSYVKPVVKAEHADHLRDKPYASRLDRDLSVDRPDLQHEKQRRRLDRERLREDEKDRRERDRDDKHLGHENREIDSMQQKKKSSRRVDDVVELFSHGESNICVYSISTSPFNGESDLRSLYTQEFRFCEKVKERLSSSAYQEFLQCLHIYSKEIVSRVDLKNLVSDILGQYTDLTNGFDEFLACCENIDGFLANVINKKHQPRCSKPEDQHMDRESDRNEKGKERDYEKEREKDWDRFGSKDTGQRALFNKEKNDFYKPIAELDLSDCECCTPSYRLLPKNYPLPPSSHRSEMGASVLNDFWVSVTSGSEDYSFKHMRKNQYEESLFRCEDDRFEMDMLLESVNASIRHVEDLIDKMQDNSTINSDTPLRIEDHLTALNLRCIERLYGDHGLDVMDVLRKNASLALPVILTRLIQKQEEWSRCRSDFNKVWAEVYAKNYHKSLDHRSFYFKQQDMKNLATKALLTEIKDMNEKRREDDMLLAVAAGNRWPITPNMQFEFTDSDIHDDIYSIIKYSSREVCSSMEQVNKVMRIWTTLLNVILGTSRSHCTEDTEGALKSIASNICGNNIGTNGSHYATCVIGENKHINPGSKFCEGMVAREADSCHDRCGNSETDEKQGGFCNPDRAPRGDHSTSVTQVQGKPISVSTPKTISKTKNINICTEPLGGNHSLSLRSQSQHDDCAVTLKTFHSEREIMMSQHQQTIKTPHLPEGCNVIPASSAHEVGIVESTGMLKHCLGFTTLNSSKTEREEGELSPIGDSEEDNFEGFDGPIRDHAIPKDAAASNGHDANDEAEESTQRSTEDSENASGDREDTSSSESGDADECSHEDIAEDVEQDDHNTKAESEGEAEESTDAHGAAGEGISMPLSEKFLNTAKPLGRHVPSALHDKENKGSHIFYGNDSIYVFFRLHQVLYERMLSAKSNSASSEKKWKNVKDVGSFHLYEKFKTALYSFLDGSADSTKFEDECRATIGTQSYVLFTLDKLVYKIVKQLQGIASDETCNKLLQLHVYEKSRKPGRFSDLGYFEDARIFLHDENIYRFETCVGPKRFSIQLMECGYEKTDAAFFMDPSFATYLYNDFLTVALHGNDTDSVFLERNKRKNENHGGNCATWDDYDRIVIYNGLECKLSINTLKISYVLDTEDLFYRKKRRKLGGNSSCYSQGAAKVENFHRFISRWHNIMTT